MNYIRQNNLISRFIVWIVSIPICINLLFPYHTRAQENFSLPNPGQMIMPTNAYKPALIKGITVYPNNPFEMNFIVDDGDENLKEDALKEESRRLITYFLTSLTVPEQDMWVNLSPYEKDRIITETFGYTEMGRDMLAQDYILKQITSSLMYPENDFGEKFWDKVYEDTSKRYGITDIPMDTFNKVWIVPDKAVVYENQTSAFVVESHLKVMLDEDYLAKKHKNTGNQKVSENKKINSTITKNIIKEIIIPELENEVNNGVHFVQLRQIFNSMILAVWYKKKLKKSLIGQIYVDKSKIAGIDIEDKEIKEKIYNQYLEAFKKGVFDYIKEEYDPISQQIIPRKYFSGGMTWNLGQTQKIIDNAMLTKLPRIERETLLPKINEIRDSEFLNVQIRLAEPMENHQNTDPAMISIRNFLKYKLPDISDTVLNEISEKIHDLIENNREILSSLENFYAWVYIKNGLSNISIKFGKNAGINPDLGQEVYSIEKSIIGREILLSEENGLGIKQGEKLISDIKNRKIISVSMEDADYFESIINIEENEFLALCADTLTEFNKIIPDISDKSFMQNIRESILKYGLIIYQKKLNSPLNGLHAIWAVSKQIYNKRIEVEEYGLVNLKYIHMYPYDTFGIFTYLLDQYSDKFLNQIIKKSTKKAEENGLISLKLETRGELLTKDSSIKLRNIYEQLPKGQNQLLSIITKLLLNADITVHFLNRAESIVVQYLNDNGFKNLADEEKINYFIKLGVTKYEIEFFKYLTTLNRNDMNSILFETKRFLVCHLNVFSQRDYKDTFGIQNEIIKKLNDQLNRRLALKRLNDEENDVNKPFNTDIFNSSNRITNDILGIKNLEEILKNEKTGLGQRFGTNLLSEIFSDINLIAINSEERIVSEKINFNFSNDSEGYRHFLIKANDLLKNLHEIQISKDSSYDNRHLHLQRQNILKLALIIFQKNNKPAVNGFNAATDIAYHLKIKMKRFERLGKIPEEIAADKIISYFETELLRYATKDNAMLSDEITRKEFLKKAGLGILTLLIGFPLNSQKEESFRVQIINNLSSWQHRLDTIEKNHDIETAKILLNESFNFFKVNLAEFLDSEFNDLIAFIFKISEVMQDIRRDSKDAEEIILLFDKLETKEIYLNKILNSIINMFPIKPKLEDNVSASKGFDATRDIMRHIVLKMLKKQPQSDLFNSVNLLIEARKKLGLGYTELNKGIVGNLNDLLSESFLMLDNYNKIKLIDTLSGSKGVFNKKLLSMSKDDSELWNFFNIAVAYRMEDIIYATVQFDTILKIFSDYQNFRKITGNYVRGASSAWSFAVATAQNMDLYDIEITEENLKIVLSITVSEFKRILKRSIFGEKIKENILIFNENEFYDIKIYKSLLQHLNPDNLIKTYKGTGDYAKDSKSLTQIYSDIENVKGNTSILFMGHADQDWFSISRQVYLKDYKLEEALSENNFKNYNKEQKYEINLLFFQCFGSDFAENIFNLLRMTSRDNNIEANIPFVFSLANRQKQAIFTERDLEKYFFWIIYLKNEVKGEDLFYLADTIDTVFKYQDPTFMIPPSDEAKSVLQNLSRKTNNKFMNYIFAGSIGLNKTLNYILTDEVIKPADVGGVDFNPSYMDLQIKRDENGIPLPLEFQDFQNIDIKGFYPVIINIAPVNNLPMLLGELDPGPDDNSAHEDLLTSVIFYDKNKKIDV